MPIDEQKIGELIGTVSGLSQAFSTMQQSQESNRKEVIDIFKEMRNDIRDLSDATTSSADKLATSMAHHIADDNAVHTKVESIQQWRNSVSPQLALLWDERNKTTGILSMSRFITAGIYALMALAAGYFGGVSHK